MTSPRPVVIERVDGTTQTVIHLNDGTPSDCVRALQLEGRPVLVIVGGADRMEDDTANAEIAAKLRTLMDRAIVPAAVAAGAVVLTGGTDAGIMRIAGHCFANRGAVTLVGVAPEARVVNPAEASVSSPSDRAVLERNHSHFVLTPGEEWGSETDILFGLAERIAQDRRSGAVILANGGSVAQQEVRVFIEAGWPVVSLAGTGRAADELARAWDEQQPSPPRGFWRGVARVAAPRKVRHGLARVATPRKARQARVRVAAWGELDSAQVEIHSVRDEPSEAMERRLAWHLSGAHLLKNCWGNWAAYDDAARSGRRLTLQVQVVMVSMALCLVVGSVVYGIYIEEAKVMWVLVMLPLLITVSGVIVDFLVPRRDWMVLRGAAQETERAIYRYRASTSRTGRSKQADRELLDTLATIRQRILRSGVRSVAAPPVGRPHQLSNANDKLGTLTVREYATVRMDGQLTYYRREAARLQRRQLWTVAGSALLAALATAAATRAVAAVWVPCLVLVASTLMIMQQRARWQERITLFATAIADLQATRDSQYMSRRSGNLGQLVDAVETVLERENLGWLQSMGQSAADIRTYRQPLVPI